MFDYRDTKFFWSVFILKDKFKVKIIEAILDEVDLFTRNIGQKYKACKYL
jgi:hypothetical protein